MAENNEKTMPMDTLQDKIRARKTPVALTLAPTLNQMPSYLLQGSKTSEAVSDAYLAFCGEILEKAAGTVPAVIFKPSAFEAIGWRGVKAMSQLIIKAKELGLYVIADAVKSDVSEHAALVRSAYLGSEYGSDCDSVTLSGYAASDGIKPYLDYCVEKDKTVFVVVKSANASTREFQELVTGDRDTYMVLGDLCQRLAKKTVGKWGFSAVGAVFGPAYSRNMDKIRKRWSDTFFLVPEFGGQGGKIFDCAPAFNKYGHGAIIATAASLTAAWQTYNKDERDFADAAMEEILRVKSDVRSMVQVL